jgi:hypothetical protein
MEHLAGRLANCFLNSGSGWKVPSVQRLESRPVEFAGNCRLVIWRVLIMTGPEARCGDARLIF